MKKHIIYGIGGIAIGLFAMYFLKDYIDSFIKQNFSPAPSKAK